MDQNLRRSGIAAGWVSAALALAYVAAQLLEWMGLLGSGGGPERSSTPLGLVLLLTPSLLLGSAFVLLAGCVVAGSLASGAAQARQACGFAGLAFASAYAALTGGVYFLQLGFVAPRLGSADPMVTPFRFIPFQSALYAVDLLGYAFMSVSCGLLALALPAGKPARSARLALVATAALAPFILFQVYVHGLIWIAALWGLTFPAAAVLTARWFARG